MKKLLTYQDALEIAEKENVYGPYSAATASARNNTPEDPQLTWECEEYAYWITEYNSGDRSYQNPIVCLLD